jgi:hypothetical protein
MNTTFKPVSKSQLCPIKAQYKEQSTILDYGAIRRYRKDVLKKQTSGNYRQLGYMPMWDSASRGIPPYLGTRVQ